MKNKIKKYLLTSIAFVLGILITLGSVIFQNFSIEQQISIFKNVLYVLIALCLIIILYFAYLKIGIIKWKMSNKYRDWIGIEGRIKREINQIKQGKRGSYIYSSDMDEVLKNPEKFKNIKDFDLLWNKLLEYDRKLRNTDYFDFRID